MNNSHLVAISETSRGIPHAMHRDRTDHHSQDRAGEWWSVLALCTASEISRVVSLLATDCVLFIALLSHLLLLPFHHSTTHMPDFADMKKSRYHLFS